VNTNDRDRLEQLRVLRARLEKMPPTAHRDWMLSEVRARAVDVETGVTPARLGALPGGEIEISLERLPAKPPAPPVKTRPVKPAPPAPKPPVAVVAREPAPFGVVDLLEQGGVLNLDDRPVGDTGAARPWSAGLRG
jgi:hypothetical protein